MRGQNAFQLRVYHIYGIYNNKIYIYMIVAYVLV